MDYKIDIKRIADGNIHVQGWVLPKDPSSEVTFEVLDKNKNHIDFHIVRLKRDDVAEIHLEDYKGNRDFGFDIEFPYVENDDDTYCLIIKTENQVITEKLSKRIIDGFNTASRKKKELIIAYFNKNTFKRAFDFLVKEGPKEFLKKTKRKLSGLTVDYDYSEWYELTKPTDDEIESQRLINCKQEIKFSIVIPIYDTSDEFLQLLFDSILKQTYTNYEVCVADATDYKTCKNSPKNFFESLFVRNEHLKEIVKIKYLDENKSIADNTNEAISMAKGDYIVLCDHDDALTLDALYEVASVINDKPNLELIYSDEDKVDTKDASYFEPAFKPAFNLDMLLSVNYFCHLTTIKKTLLDELYKKDGVYERAEYNGAQDYDLFLRLVNLIINRTYNNGTYDVSTIYHIPKVLYHWRCHKKSTAKNTDSKTYAFTNGEKAILDFYRNTKINFSPVENVEKGFDFGIYHTIYKKEIEEPLISVIIPNKDHIKDLELAISSLYSGNYKNIEIIICENNSTEKETFEYYDSLRTNEKIKIVKYEGIFNYSKINNFASKFANGEYLLFLNNDIEMINKNSLHEMISYLKRDDVGAVGAKLLYKDKSYQHAGVVIGIGGIADHLFKGINDSDHTYMNRAQMVQDLNAVTAACLMTKKSVFDKVNGFDEGLRVAFNDIDLCLRIRKVGYLIVYNPYSSFFHYESKSRGLEDTPEKVKRFNNEFAYFVKRWEQKLNEGDEYYNRSLTLRQNNMALRNLKYEKIGEPFPIPDEIREIMKGI